MFKGKFEFNLDLSLILSVIGLVLALVAIMR
jgi:hypothetical protein